MNKPWDYVRRHPINCSSAKATFSFGKDSRFKGGRKVVCDSFYNVGSELGKSGGCGLGKGKKITFDDKNNYPPPNAYHIHSCFHKNTKGGHFSLSRDSIKYGGIFMPSHTPDPGRYHTSFNQSSSRSYSMRKKLKVVEPSYNKNPGPGQYKYHPTISPSGKYTLSNVSNCITPKMTQSRPFKVGKCKKTPGPGAYEQTKQNINNSGRYFNSKYQDSRCRSFSRSMRKDLVTEYNRRVPGPGSYSFFSEFGSKS